MLPQPPPARQRCVLAAPPNNNPSICVDASAANVWFDFAHLKAPLPMSRVLDHLGLSAKLKGPATQKRCACPIHRGDGRGRTFSVNLSADVF